MLDYNGVDAQMYCDDGTADTHTCMAAMAGGDKLYPYNFVATDYENYAVSYFCMDMLAESMKVEWFNIISKDVTISEEKLEEAKAALAEAVPEYGDLTWWNTHTTSHEGCEYDWTL